MTYPLTDDDWPVEVCVTHKRFVPCRGDDPHTYSSDGIDVDAVRHHQQGTGEP